MGSGNGTYRDSMPYKEGSVLGRVRAQQLEIIKSLGGGSREEVAAKEPDSAAPEDPTTYLPDVMNGETSAAYQLRARKSKSMLSASSTLL